MATHKWAENDINYQVCVQSFLTQRGPGAHEKQKMH